MDANWLQRDLEFLQRDLQVLQRDLESREIAVGGHRSAAEAEPAEGGGGFASELRIV